MNGPEIEAAALAAIRYASSDARGVPRSFGGTLRRRMRRRGVGSTPAPWRASEQRRHQARDEREREQSGVDVEDVRASRRTRGARSRRRSDRRASSPGRGPGDGRRTCCGSARARRAPSTDSTRPTRPCPRPSTATPLRTRSPRERPVSATTISGTNASACSCMQPTTQRAQARVRAIARGATSWRMPPASSGTVASEPREHRRHAERETERGEIDLGDAGHRAVARGITQASRRSRRTPPRGRTAIK